MICFFSLLDESESKQSKGEDLSVFYYYYLIVSLLLFFLRGSEPHSESVNVYEKSILFTRLPNHGEKCYILMPNNT